MSPKSVVSFFLNLDKEETINARPTPEKQEINDVESKSWLKPSDVSSQPFLSGDKEHDIKPSIVSNILVKPPVSTTAVVEKPSDKTESAKIESNQKPTSKESRKSIKGRKPTTSSRRKKLQKMAHAKITKVQKHKKESRTKDVILVEEDSLHATMDLGGTTIPAEPTNNGSST